MARKPIAGIDRSYIVESALRVIESMRVNERYGGSARGRGIWYHGTTTKHLDSIMKNGLIPNPKEKGYGSDLENEALAGRGDDRKLEIEDYEKITPGQYASISKMMRARDYDIRGAEDAKALIARQAGLTAMRENPQLADEHGGHSMQAAVEIGKTHRRVTLYDDWAEVVGIVLGMTKQGPLEQSKRTASSVLRRVIKEFGLTYNAASAGYIMPNGGMLDLSGGHHGVRGDDHRIVLQFMPGESSRLKDFVSLGPIRMIYGQDTMFDIGKKPTPEQLRQLRKIIDLKNGDVYIDIWSDMGKDSREYKRGVSPDRVIADIEYFYKHHELPPLSKTASFHTDESIDLRSMLEASVAKPNLVSYGGVYITSDLGKASLAATSVASQQGRKYNPLIVIMEIQPRTLIADEDDITSIASQVNPDDLVNSAQVASWVLMAAKYSMQSSDLSDQSKQEMQEWAKEAKQTYIDRSMARLRYMMIKIDMGKLHPELEKKMVAALDAMWMPAVERAASYFEKEHGKYWKRDWLNNLERYTGSRMQYENMPMPPSPKTSEAIFRKHIDGLTRLVKRHIVQQDKRRTARSLQPIGFKGSNRIVAIVEEVVADDKNTAIRLHYGKVPAEFLKAWEENVGKVQWVNDQKPRIVFDRYASTVSESVDSARWVKFDSLRKALRKLGAREEHVDVSGSSYFRLPDGRRLRVSDHGAMHPWSHADLYAATDQDYHRGESLKAKVFSLWKHDDWGTAIRKFVKSS